jgi:hypothetical protein
MKKLHHKHRVYGLAFACALLLSGCAASKGPIYYWGDYQSQTHGYLTGEESPDEQIQKLEEGLEKAHAAGKPLPPGYQAHLGILYAQKQQSQKMIQYFNAEKAQYPESAPYIDFLLSTKTAKK